MIRRTGPGVLLIAAMAFAGCRSPTWRLVEGDLDGLVLGATAIKGTGDAFLVGADGLVLRFDGTTWCRYAPVTDRFLWWTWGASPTDVYAGGDDGTLVHYDGARWTKVALPIGANQTVWGIWGSGGEDVWLVGGNAMLGGPGFILRGSAKQGFSAVPADDDPATPKGTPKSGLLAADLKFNLFKAWGAAADDVWIVGDRGEAIHWDGHAFAGRVLKRGDLDPGEPPDRLFTVSGSASNDIYAVGGNQNGVVFHYDGSTWSPIQEPSLPPLNGVSALAGEDTLVVGFQGTVRRRNGATWIGENITETMASGRVPDFHAVAQLGGGRAFAVGGEMLKAAPPRKGAIAYRSIDPLPAPVIVACAESRDGGVPDAAVPDLAVAELAMPADFSSADLSSADLAMSVDAAFDLATPDLAIPVDQSMPSDMAGIKVGQPCPNRGGCAEGLECWEIGFGTQHFICTHYCKMPSDCGNDFGPNPQCAAPGCQALGINRCIPHDLVGCQGFSHDM